MIPQKTVTLIDDYIKHAKRILITAHQFPDTDAVGSALALYLSLKKQGYDAKIWLNDYSPKLFSFLPSHTHINKEFIDSYKFDLLIVLDSSHLNRVCNYHYITDASHAFKTINIDHHPDNSNFGDVNLTLSISSVGELLFHLFSSLGWDISLDIATCIYAAISFDTGRFAFKSVSSDTLRCAAELIDKGVEPDQITQALDENKSINDFELIKKAIETLITNDEKKYAYCVITKDAPKAKLKVIDFIRQLKDFHVFIIFQELKSNLTKINLRSKNDFDVSDFAQAFNGGGHKQAAAF